MARWAPVEINMSKRIERLLNWSLGAGRGLQGVAGLLQRVVVTHLWLALLGGLPLHLGGERPDGGHPQALVAAYYWAPTNGISERTVPLGYDLTPAFLNSPIRKIFEGDAEVRRRLTGRKAVMDFGILGELRDQGITDYVVLPVRFSDGLINAMSFATTRPSGFSPANLEAIRAGVLYLSPLLEIQAERAIARTVLEVYLGRETGPKVLAGSITRGNSETIDAALWFCDLRNFTMISEALSTEAVVTLLNSYFSIVGAAVESHGGEILKFIGDAALAIFPIDQTTDSAAACAAAMAAACEAMAEKNQLKVEGVSSDLSSVDFGVALHVGQVAYGNIGAPARLDFTVIGPAVNTVSRIAGLCGQLDQPILTSTDFAAVIGPPLEAIGSFTLKGIENAETVYALPQSVTNPAAIA